MPVLTHNTLESLTSAPCIQYMYQGSCHSLHPRKRHILMTYKDCFQLDSQPASIVTPLRHKIPIDASWTGIKRPRHDQLERN
jgi:hypothetical protein